MALCITARGIVFSGLRASAPSVVALSKPTKLKSASTRPSRRPLPVMPRRWSCVPIRVPAVAHRTSATTTTITDTEVASIHNISRAEIFTSRHAIHIETPVTSSDSATVENPCPVASRSKQVCIMIEAADHARSGGHISEQQTPGGDRAHPRRQSHRSVTNTANRARRNSARTG